MEQFENNNNIEQQEPDCFGQLVLVRDIRSVMRICRFRLSKVGTQDLYPHGFRPNQRRQKRWRFFRVERLRGFGYHDGVSKCRQ